MNRPETVSWIASSPSHLLPGRVRLLDQTRLPEHEVFLETASPEDIFEAIQMLRVRGAPAIGVAAAMGVAVAVQNELSSRAVIRAVRETADYLETSRPTAVNLFWALNRMRQSAKQSRRLPADELKRHLVREALAIQQEDKDQCLAIGRHGLSLLKNGCTVLTHCNAGALATAGIGTALAPVYTAADKGWKIKVFADETRPLLQGSRLTCWELQQSGIDVTLICDHTAALVLRDGKIDIVFTGADRIAANGDSANKVGTYGLARQARIHGVPFYILAPTTTFDMDLASGDDMPIEERAADEVRKGFGPLTAPANVPVYCPAFDVTPAEFIDGIVCEQGILRPPFTPAMLEAIQATS